MPWKWGTSGQDGLGEKGESRSGVLSRTFPSTYSILFCTLVTKQSYTSFYKKFWENHAPKYLSESLLFIQRTMYTCTSFTIFPHTGLKIILILQIGYWRRVRGQQISVVRIKPFLSPVTCTLQLPQRTEPPSPSQNHWAQIYFTELNNGSQQYQSHDFFPNFVL